MVRRKKRYILIDGNITKGRCRSMNLYLIEKDHYSIVKCYLSDLEQIKTRFEEERIQILSISGTLKALRKRKEEIKQKYDRYH